MQQFEIDLVYLWVDGNDREWLAKKYAFLGKEMDLITEATTFARNANNDELKYSLRSVEKNAPWIRKIFILTDMQRPQWLINDNDKIQVVDIREILPSKALPCYNSVIIEHFLYRIPDLKEHFLYANDDMFLNRPVEFGSFFTKEGYPIVRLKRGFLGKWIMSIRRRLNIHINIYRKTIDRSAGLIEKKFGIYYSGTPHHNIDSYLKSDYRKVVEEYFSEEILQTIENHIRTENDIQRIIYLFFALAVKRSKVRYVGRSESCRIRVQENNYQRFIDLYNPVFFCLNDTIHVTDKDRERIVPFLNSLFPYKSNFER